MKRTSTLFSAAFLSFALHAQVPNGGFENWGSPDPVNWETSNNNTGNVINVTQVSPGHSGSSAMKMEAWTYMNYTFSSAAACPNNSGFFPYSGHPLTFTGWYKSNLLNGDKVMVNCALQLGGSSYGGAGVTITNSTSVYQQFTANFLWNGPNNCDSGAVGIGIWTSTGGGIGLTPGTWIIFDDLQFSNSNGTGDEQSDAAITTIYPNPAANEAAVVYTVKDAGDVKVSLCDLSGREISVLVNEEQHEGTFRVFADVTQLSAGTYFIKIETTGGTSVRKLNCVR